jgi:general secretion pathway protein D
MPTNAEQHLAVSPGRLENRMKVRLSGGGVLLLLCLACGGGNLFFREGRRAELRKDYDTALVYFQKALQSQPDNSLFMIHEKTARTLAADFHLRQGRRLMASGRPDEASGEFQKAVSIDPTNMAASQELARIVAAQTAAKRTREQELKQALKPVEEPAGPAPVKLKALPPEPIGHIHISGDAKKVFESLGKLGELNVAFAKDFSQVGGQTVSLDLTGVKLEDALHILADETKTFWKAVTPNTILVIPDNQVNHRDYDEQVLRTVYLSNPFAPADRTQITTVLKTMLGPQTHIVDNPQANAIIISDTPARVAAAEKLIHDLDHGKAEVLVEVAILEADRERIRDLGLSPVALSNSTQIGIGFNPPGGTTTTTSGGSTTTVPGTLGLNQLGRISSADFSVALPGYIANALLSDTRTHILQNPSIRTTDGEKATMKIGSKVPFAQGSFLPSFGGATTGGAGGGFGLLASTQFQYQDVGVNVEITPHVLATGEVNLHAKIEITAVGPSVPLGGIAEPSFTQRTIEHDIRLKAGEINLLGGLIQSQASNAVSGLPGLGQIPLLRYLFSTEHRDVTETEILVMLTPRVVRLPDLPAGSEVAVGAPSQTGPNFPNIIPQPPIPQEPGNPQ